MQELCYSACHGRSFLFACAALLSFPAWGESPDRYAVGEAMHFIESPGIFQSRVFVIDRRDRHALACRVRWRSVEKTGPVFIEQSCWRRPIPGDPRNATAAISATFPLVKDGSNKWFTPYAWWSIDDATGRIAFCAISGPAPSGKEVNSPAGCTDVTVEAPR